RGEHSTVPTGGSVRQRRGSEMRTLVIAPDLITVTRKFLADNGLGADGVYQVGLGSVGVLRTPTVFLVDSHGVIRDVILGWMDAVRQEQFLREIADVHY